METYSTTDTPPVTATPVAQQLPVSPRLSNADIAPVKEQTWTFYNLIAMWMSNVHSVAGYTFAAGLFALGLAGWEVFSAMIVGITLIYFFTNWAGRGGQKYGIAFAAQCRPAFGVFGANIPSLIKASTATVWYGIQTWVASTALVVVVLKFFPDLEPLTQTTFLGLSTLGWACMLFMWLAQLLVFFYGWEAIRRFTDWAGPAIYVIMLLLVVWIVTKAGGMGEISFTLGTRDLSAGQAFQQWGMAVAFTVAWFAGTTLNFADFARLVKTPKAMRQANFLGLPINFMLFALAAVITTSGGLKVFGEMIMDPVELVSRIDNTTAVILGTLTFVTATIATNIVANFVSAAMDVTNLLPKLFTFRRAGLIASVLSVAVMPWKLYANPTMIQWTLGTLGAFIGPIFGIVMIEYYVRRRETLNLNHLYSEDPRGAYWFKGGFNPKAIWALVLAGLLTNVIAHTPALEGLAAYSWFIGCALGIGFHLLISGVRAPAVPEAVTESTE